MKKIISFFKNRIVISIIGLIVLSLLIWFVGPLIKFGDENAAPLGEAIARLVAIIVLVVLWGLNNLRIVLQDKKQNEELVDDLQDNQANNQNSILTEQTSEEMQQINERFAQALATLKKLKFKGRGAKKALYELPWYIIIGPPGSGKTTALVNSSLDFPLAEEFGKGALQGVGGTRNCDWWFTNEAVLIDTAGRYTTQDSHKVADSSAWEGFLNLLKKNRRRRPINGAIIAISLQDLLIQSEEERMQHARIIRSRIDELMDKLQVRFPIYLMFTKSDLVSGFSEFFDDLGKEDREQVWGISLPNAPGPSQSPDFEYLDDEYQNLVTRLYDRVLWRMHQERDVKRRGAIQGFPQQLENLKSIIDGFVRQTFVKNRFQFQPYLRGVYFSSGTQDGTPIDRLMTSVSSNFGFNREAVQQPHQQGKSFFLGQLFRSIIFPESELVGSNRRYETFIRWSQRAGYVGLSGMVVVMLAIWAGSLTRHEMYMHEVESYIAEFNAENKRFKSWSSDLRAVLPSLKPLAKASVVYDQEEHPWLSGLGLYDGEVDSTADEAYFVQLKELFLPRLLNYLESSIKRGHQGGDLYNTFRTYVMFNKLQYMDKQLVTEWFSSNWDDELQGQASKRNELKQHLAALLSLPLKPADLNKHLVKSTRSLLLRVPVAQRIYRRIRTSPEYTQQVDMLNEFGEDVRFTFKLGPKVNEALHTPLLFTKEGYGNVDFSAGSDLIANIVNERWVLSDDNSENVDFVKDDLDRISKKVKRHYLSEYKQHWDNIYASLNVKPFSDLRHANSVLSRFTDPVYSPLLSILQVGAANTELTTKMFARMDEHKDRLEDRKAKLVGFTASRVKSTIVDKQFNSINALVRESSKSPAPINAVIQRIQTLQDFMTEMSLAPDPGKKAFDIAKARYLSGSGDAITSLRAYAKSTPQPVKRWLNSLADESWKIMLQSANQYVNSEWRTQIYSPYTQGLSGRYPLNRQAKDELALADFSEFFRPGGTMDKFYADFIKPFVNTRTDWNNRVIDKYSLGLSNKAISQFKNAQDIKSIFFKNNPKMPSITFQLRPYKMNKNDARFILEVGDKRVSYSHGPKFWKTVQWLGNDEQNRVRVIFEDLDEQQHSKTYDGPWAWFRLQDQSSLQKTRKSNVYLVTYKLQNSNDGGDLSLNTKLRNKSTRSIKYEMKAKSVNNPFEKQLLASFICPERI